MGFRSLADLYAYVRQTERLTGAPPSEIVIHEDDLYKIIAGSNFFLCQFVGFSMDNFCGIPIKVVPPYAA